DDAFGQADELEAPAGLERRLVEAGKDAAGVGGLELRHRQRSRAVQAAQTGAELAGPGEVEHGASRRERVVEAQGDGLALRIGAHLRLERAVLHPRARPRHLQTDSVQVDLTPGGVQADLRLHPAFEGALLEVRREMRAVADGLAVGGKPEVLAEGHGTSRESAGPTPRIARPSPGKTRRCMLGRVVIVQHEPGEGAGTLAPLLPGARVVRTFAGDPVPREADALVVLGGGMGAYEADRLPHLQEEIDLLRSCVERGRPVLGICLGSQLLARALGAEVARAPVKEIGFYRVRLTGEARTDALFAAAPPDFVAFHWHGDAFTLPEGAVPLASSTLTPMQAYRF